MDAPAPPVMAPAQAVPPPPTASRAPVAGWRIGAACAFMAILLFGALLYHDGAVAVDPIRSVDAAGEYRVKGELVSYDEEAERILVRNGEDEILLHWNATTPQAGAWYVVSVVTAEDGELFAAALSRVLVIRGTWA